MELLPFLTGLKEVVVTIAAATGAFVAYKGLTKWKKELKGRSNHETAKLILTSTFNVRKAVHIVRNNWISLDEYPTSQNVSDADKYTHMFKQRWEILDSAIHELEYAKIQGFEICYLETLSFMTTAQKLYKRIGFENIDGPMGNTGHNSCEVWMTKKL